MSLPKFKCWFLRGEFRVQPRTNSSEILGGRSGNGAEFESLRFPPSNHYYTIAPYQPTTVC
jgi:hypothetical protein